MPVISPAFALAIHMAKKNARAEGAEQNPSGRAECSEALKPWLVGAMDAATKGAVQIPPPCQG
jgi:hypothetical protein